MTKQGQWFRFWSQWLGGGWVAPQGPPGPPQPCPPMPYPLSPQQVPKEDRVPYPHGRRCHPRCPVCCWCPRHWRRTDKSCHEQVMQMLPKNPRVSVLLPSVGPGMGEPAHRHTQPVGKTGDVGSPRSGERSPSTQPLHSTFN